MRYRIDSVTHKLIPTSEWLEKYGTTPHGRSAYVIGALQPYRSTVTGETIDGRTAHREHLREHDMVEVGNERMPGKTNTDVAPAGQDVKDAIEQIKGGHGPPPDESMNDWQ